MTNVESAIETATAALTDPTSSDIQTLALAVLAIADELSEVRLQRDAALSREQAREKAR